jgi:hypothetical protein
MAVRKKKEPIHQIFYLCSSFTPDAAWKEFLKDCSFGKFPKGVRFENGTIKCVRKKQAFVQAIPNDAEKALSVIITVFRDKLGIKTTREKKSAAAKFENHMANSKLTTWKEATTIAAKNFAARFAEHYMLTNLELNELILLLTISVKTKILEADRIHMENHVISHIDGLRFDPFSRRITLGGHMPKVVPNLNPIPLDYKPTPQVNHPVLYAKLLDHHTNKIR